MKKFVLVGMAVVCVAVLTALVTSRFWLPSIPAFLIIDEKPEKSDMIIVPSGNEQAKRLDHAISLFRDGYAPRILLCGEIALVKETGLNLGKLYVTSRGVPEDAVIVEEDSKSTFENALFTRKIIEDKKVASVILVTYPLHTRRSKKIFKEIYPRDVRIIACCRRADFDTAGWWRDRNRSRDVAYEYFAYVWHVLCSS